MRLGRYELLYKLAKGGMGEVFVARRKGPGDIEKQVVIKRIRRDLSGNPRFVEMFLREAKVSMTLSHKNIAAVFDFGRVGQELFLAMEHVRGRDLGRALRAARKKGVQLSPAAVAFIGIEVCRALDYAQRTSAGEPIIHRDLSPKNLLLSFSGEVVVADFGLAIESSNQLEDGGVRGTPAYLSPEQARGEALDSRSDLFSLGLVLRELVEGEATYSGETPEAIIAMARDAKSPPISEDVPAKLRAAIERATTPDRKDRFASPRAMQRGLDKFLIDARAAGAEQPADEIAEWLGGLFDADDTPRRDELGDSSAPAVTFLDDGDVAVVEGLRSVGAETMASLAETIGDSALESDSASGAELERPEEARSRWGLWAALLAGLGLSVGVAFMLMTNNGDAPPDAGALVAIDAMATDTSSATDAAPRDAALVDARTIDAAVDAAPPVVVGSGWLRVQSRPWARVSIRGSPGCDETPCRIKLREGKHTVRLVNPITGARASRNVTIRPGATTDLSVTLPKPAE